MAKFRPARTMRDGAGEIKAPPRPVMSRFAISRPHAAALWVGVLSASG